MISIKNRGPWVPALLLVALVAGCGNSTSAIDLSPTTPGGGAGTGVAGGHGPSPVVLGMSGSSLIRAKSAISNVPTSAVTENMVLSPAAASGITQFALTLPAG